ncbi:DUF3558 family protein [Rhodococcus sp. BP-316]|uniref:DUF3558 family protein n=1 Tax=Rhodococcus sp. BP-316 TaxID=2739445 RepID=UPI001C9B9CAB|nr:DUF3558 family protein [Rhodococcus sp. BP-316]MBY6682815.1 DUF3558 family protein [Rhodococcus sp. BP-316]
MAALVFCGACSPGVSGEPVAELWDPCTIPSDAVAAAGVNAEIVDSGQFDQDGSQWKYCSFRQDSFFVSMLSTDTSIAEVAANPRATNVLPVQAGDREALSYTELGSEAGKSCFLAFTTHGGSAIIRVRAAADAADFDNPCTRAVDLSDVLEPYFPR